MTASSAHSLWFPNQNNPPYSPGLSDILRYIPVAATSFNSMSGQDSTSAAQPNRGPTVVILVSLLTSLSVVTTTVRLTVRYLKRQLGTDDMAIGASAILSILQWAFNILQARNGFGQHIGYLSSGQVEDILKWAWGSEVILSVVLPLTKVSICLFILRIMDRGWMRWFLYGLMTGLVATCGGCFVILFAQCRPLHAYWDREAGTCWNVDIFNDSIWVQVGKTSIHNEPRSFMLTSSCIGYGIMADLIISLLPIIILWDLKIARRVKVLVSSLISLGLM